MLLEGGLVFRGVDDDLAGEAVAEGVQRRLFLAFLGARASREAGRWRGWRRAGIGTFAGSPFREQAGADVKALKRGYGRRSRPPAHVLC